MDNQGQNSYVLEPKEDEKFPPSKVKKIIEGILNEKLERIKFDPNTAPNIAEDLVRLIRAKVKAEIKMPRYKFAVKVVIGEMKGQGIRVASKCLWDSSLDNWASYSFTNDKQLYAVGIVYGVYFE